MTNDFFIGLISQYGILIGLLSGGGVLLFLLWKGWPIFYAFVSSVNNVVTLPTALGEIKAQIADSGADKSRQISELKASVESKFEKYDTLADNSVRERKLLGDGLERIEKELTTNHGSSLKDAIYRIEEHLGLRVVSARTAPIVQITNHQA